VSHSVPEISVVLPVYNERQNLEPLLAEIAAALTHRCYEVVATDDGSTDGSLAELQRLKARYPVLRILSFAEHAGQSAALTAGLDAVRGAYVVTMDADGQNDPADIPRLLTAICESEAVGAAVGYRGRRADGWWRLLQSRIANATRNWITGDRVRDTGCSLRVMRRRAVHRLPRFDGMHRFLPTLLRRAGERRRVRGQMARPSTPQRACNGGQRRIMARRQRLDPEIFHLPVEKMKQGYYSDKYFVRARDVLLADGHSPRVVMQVFGKAHAFLGGVDEAIAILKFCADSWQDLDVRALYDGDEIEPWETVMTVEGTYHTFAHLETLYLGVLARRTRVGTNTRLVVEAAKPKEVMFFPARHDHWLVQTGDGYAAHIAGAIGVSTDAQASWWGSEGVGTVPHAIIAAYEGDTVLATKRFAEHMPDSVRLITLVDWDNDCVGTSLAAARSLGERLYGVRLDTAETIVDNSIVAQMGRFKPTGVNPQLVRNVRTALDAEGFNHVKIAVSGGFTVSKIREFEDLAVPVDAYGVGSSLFRGNFDFTADVVMVDGKPCAKVGREYRANDRLEKVD
jgi:nicotinate phosphoribosyltransferase